MQVCRRTDKWKSAVNNSFAHHAAAFESCRQRLRNMNLLKLRSRCCICCHDLCFFTFVIALWIDLIIIIPTNSQCYFICPLSNLQIQWMMQQQPMTNFLLAIKWSFQKMLQHKLVRPITSHKSLHSALVHCTLQPVQKTKTKTLWMSNNIGNRIWGNIDKEPNMMHSTP